MAEAVGVDVAQIVGSFDLDSLSCYNVVNVGRLILNSDVNTLNFCCEVGVLRLNRNCKGCRRALKLRQESRADHATPVVFRCENKKCSKSYVSLRDGSVFERSKLSISQILLLINLFCGNICQYSQIRYQAQLGVEKLSNETIADWLSYCREICSQIVARETPKLIGGRGLTVEVDESKFGKRKYNKGRHVEGQWVLGGICRETGDIFLATCPNNKRDATTLLDIIERHVHKESTIVTDCWRAYDRLDQDGWQHMTVNHEYNFVGMYNKFLVKRLHV